jgi:hypothetical protein
MTRLYGSRNMPRCIIHTESMTLHCHLSYFEQNFIIYLSMCFDRGGGLFLPAPVVRVLTLLHFCTVSSTYLLPYTLYIPNAGNIRPIASTVLFTPPRYHKLASLLPFLFRNGSEQPPFLPKPPPVCNEQLLAFLYSAFLREDPQPPAAPTFFLLVELKLNVLDPPRATEVIHEPGFVASLFSVDRQVLCEC